jgi:hypothetical protein
MSDLCRLIWCALIGLFRSRAALEAEILVLRHQLNVLRRKSPKRLAFGNVDRLVLAGLYRVAPGVLDALKILKPQTVIRWHRAGFGGKDLSLKVLPMKLPVQSRPVGIVTLKNRTLSPVAKLFIECVHRLVKLDTNK